MSDHFGKIEAPVTDKFFSKNVFEEPGYDEQYDKLFSVVMKHINTDKLAGKTVIDLACGYGGYGRRFIEKGARVIFIDGRQANLDAVRSLVPGAETYLMDLEKDDYPKEVKGVDLILCMGLVYHTKDPRVIFRKMAEVSQEVFVETVCLDHDGVALVNFEESTEPNQFSLTGYACRPSPKWIEKALGEVGYDFVKDISDRDANKIPQPGKSGVLYDWDFKRTCGWRRDECALRRMFKGVRGNGSGLIRR